jgi:hypothetical protein
MGQPTPPDDPTLTDGSTTTASVLGRATPGAFPTTDAAIGKSALELGSSCDPTFGTAEVPE